MAITPISAPLPITASPVTSRPFKRLSFSLIGYLLSFVGIRTSLIFKRTCRSYYNIVRLDVALSIPAKDFIHLAKMKKYTQWSGDTIKRIECRNYPPPFFAVTRGTAYLDGSIGTPFESLDIFSQLKITSLKVENIEFFDVNTIQLRKISTLKTLYLGFQCDISDAGLKELSELHLRDFSLMNAKRITAVGLAYLSKMPLQNLTFAHCQNPYSRDALRCLKQMSLEELDLGVGIQELNFDWLAKDIPTLKKINGSVLGTSTIANARPIISNEDISLFIKMHSMPESRMTFEISEEEIPSETPSTPPVTPPAEVQEPIRRTFCGGCIYETFTHLLEWLRALLSPLNPFTR